MYKKDNIIYYSQKNSNDIDNNYYYLILYKIHELFIKKNYKSIISSKRHLNSTEQNLVYYNPINITESFIINISNKNKISIKIPIKGSNYTYKTIFNTINDVYSYIKLHCGEIVDR
jgi:hypothetical protein